MSETTCDVAVLGLGAMGAAALWQFAKRGVKVVGIDRFAPPHDQGSSHGDTRITRQAVGEGPAYVPLALASHRIWRELEAESGVPLLNACGTLITGPRSGASSHHGIADFVGRTGEVAKAFDIAHEMMEAGDIRRRFPQFGQLDDGMHGYFEPGGGYVFPERCIAAQLAAAARMGAGLRTDTMVDAVEPSGRNVRLRAGGQTIEAAHVVVAAGGWTERLMGAPFDTLLRVCRQVLYWFELDEPGIFPDPSPVFILTHGASDTDICYGFPPLPGEGAMKIAAEQFSQVCDPDGIERDVSPAEAQAMFDAHLEGRISGVSRRLWKSATCFYTMTPDAGFIIDRHPRMENVTVISACSGHGFKHSAAIGEALAQRYVDGASPIDLSAFALSRFGPR